MIFTIRTQVMTRLLSDHPAVLTRGQLPGPYELRRDPETDQISLYDLEKGSTLLDHVDIPEADLIQPSQFPHPVGVELIRFPGTKDRYGVDINVDMGS